MAALVVGLGQPFQRPLQLTDSQQQPLLFLPERAGLVGLGLEPSLLGGGLRQFTFQRHPPLIDLGERLGLLLQLVDPLLVVVAVRAHFLDLPVEQLEHLGVLRTERPGTGRADPLGAGLDDPLPLLLQLLILVEQPLALGLGVLGIANPDRALLFGLERGSRQGGARRVDSLEDVVQELLRGHPGDALLGGGEMGPYFVQLGLVALAGGVGFGLTLQRLRLLRAAPEAARGGGVPHRAFGGPTPLRLRFLLQPPGPLGDRGGLLFGQLELGLERHCRLAQLLEPLPTEAGWWPAAAPRRRSPRRAAVSAVRAAASRSSACFLAASSSLPSGSPARSPSSRARSDERFSLSRSCAVRSRSYPSTRERNWARSGALIAAITASSFCPVK